MARYGTVSTEPEEVWQTSGDTVPYAFDFTTYLASGQTISSATATLANLTAGTSTNPSTSISGARVTVSAASLTAGAHYRLSVAATISGSVYTAAVDIQVPF